MKPVKKNQKELDVSNRNLEIMNLRANGVVPPEEKQRKIEQIKLKEEKKQERLERLNFEFDNVRFREQARQGYVANEVFLRPNKSGEFDILINHRKDMNGYRLELFPESAKDANNAFLLALSMLSHNKNDEELYGAISDFLSYYEDDLAPYIKRTKVLKFVSLFSKLISEEEAYPIINCLQENLIPYLQQDGQINLLAAANFVMLKTLFDAQLRDQECLQDEDNEHNILNNLLIIHRVLPYILMDIRLLSFAEQLNYSRERNYVIPNHSKYCEQLKKNINFLCRFEHEFHLGYLVSVGNEMHNWQKDNNSDLLSGFRKTVLSLRKCNEFYSRSVPSRMLDDGTWYNIYLRLQTNIMPNLGSKSKEEIEDLKLLSNQMNFLNTFMLTLLQSACSCYLDMKNKLSPLSRLQPTPANVPMEQLMPPQQMNMQRVTQPNGNNNGNQNMLLGPQK